MNRMTTVDYEDGLMEDLKDPSFAAHYLMVCLEEETEDPQEKVRLFLSALNQVVKARVQ